MLSLHSLPKSRAKTKNRVGRGNASGGNYSGRGMKGQRARSGGKGGLKLRGLKQSLMAVPKKRGFTSPYPANQPVSLDQLNQFESGATVNGAALEAAGLIRSSRVPVKILGTGSLDKKLDVQVQAVSKSALAAIEQAGGSFTATPLRRPAKQTEK